MGTGLHLRKKETRKKETKKKEEENEKQCTEKRRDREGRRGALVNTLT